MITIKNEDVISADLLSVEEANEIPKWILANGEWWWLRSPGDASYYAAYVGVDGSVDDYGDYVHDDGYAVRPALIISNLPNLEIGETVKVFGIVAQYIGSDKVLLCESIFYRNFDEKSNVYETSAIKKKLEKWFKDNKGKQVMPKIICKGVKNKGFGADAITTGMQIGGKKMARYIDAEKFEEDVVNSLDIDFQDVLQRLRKYPTADVAEVKYGEWEFIGGYGYQYRCSVCITCAEHKTKYCPNCGARMESKKK